MIFKTHFLNGKWLMALCLFLLLLPFHQSLSQVSTYQLTKDGMLIFPDKKFSGNAAVVQIRFITEKIVHVLASPIVAIEPRESLIVISSPKAVPFTTKQEDGNVELKTSSMSIVANMLTGAVSFMDSTGKKMLAERPASGRVIQPVVHEGASLYRVKQTFETSNDDAYYGLGQHQEGAWNYNGRQVTLFQNNTEVAVPFLVSVNNYGLLWDNYAYSRVGDARPYQPLSALKLFDKNGNEGWLTASYANDRNKPADIVFEKAASEINYCYLNDTKLKLPKEFAIEKGSITWSGNIASVEEGLHKIKLSYAGYVKLWLDGKLVLDYWRQAWNPGSATVEWPMKKGKKYPIVLEWIPDGSESYLNLGYLPPIPDADSNSFTFDSEAGRQVDYYFVYGKNIDEVISGYRYLTGKAPIVPKWAMGFWQSRERYKTQEELLSTVAEFRKRRIPLDNIVQDWSYWKEDQWGSQDFDTSRFPNPVKMIADLHKKFKTQLMISVWPKFYEGISSYDSFNEKGWLYKRNIADRQKDWIGKGYVSTFYDAFNKEARDGFWKLIHDKLYIKGIDAWWMDASEPDILSNVSPEKRKQQMSPTALGPAAEYMNAYPLQNAKGIYEGQRSADHDKRVFLLTRSGFAGSQRYAASIWSGDIASRWEDMKAQITAGLNFSLSGLPYWTMDIGGFSVERRYENPNEKDREEWRELQTRWYQFGAFVPLFRVHGQFPFREIYNVAPENHPAYKSMYYYNKLRYKLMPYIYSLAGDTYHKDYTIMRGLVMDFPQDKKLVNIGDQYLFGPALLINPVYSFKATERRVYLPAGQGWYDLYTGEYFAGGQHINAAAPYERMPVFVKEGSIVPLGPDLQYVAEKPADPLTLYIYGGRDASFTLYEDEGLNYNYEKGKYSQIPIQYNEKLKKVTIDNRKGKFTGMLNKRTFYIKLIDRDHASGINDVTGVLKSIKYDGYKIMVKL